MKRIGLIGGMSWESSALYYSLINGLVKERLGGMHSARCILTSVDFADIEALQSSGDWEESGRLLALEAQGLEAAGADFLVLCTNTMHRVARDIREAVGIPLLHIGDVVSREVLSTGLGTVALLGTAFTMEQPFYRNFISAYGIDVLVPPEAERASVHRIIYEELVLGVVSDPSRNELVGIIDDLVGRGAQGVILGCTELELLIGQEDSPVPVFATTRLHAAAALNRSRCADSGSDGLVEDATALSSSSRPETAELTRSSPTRSSLKESWATGRKSKRELPTGR